MSAYGTTATVEGEGIVHISGVPFQTGTEVEVIVSPKRRPTTEFLSAWQRFTAELRNQTKVPGISDQEITDEVERHRAAR
jgi:S-ribosylhomocysteine lyase LuxS involved in autoinducer biosynthesis